VFDEIPHSEKVLKRHQNSDDPCIMAWDHYKTFHFKNPPGYENVDVGLLKDSSLMGTFPISPPDVPHPFFASINMISTSVHETPAS
jgi:hypothetical protein